MEPTPDRASRLMPLVYDELRRIADRYIRRERPGQTLQATALVNEAYLRLANERPREFASLPATRHTTGLLAEEAAINIGHAEKGQ